MPNLTGILGLYWGARREPLEQCAGNAYESLRGLEDLGYDRYFLRGPSRRAALRREVELAPESLLAILAKGVSYTDVPRKPIPELGWHMGFWSGGSDDESYSIDFHVGSYSHHVGNNVTLNLPHAGCFSLAAAPERALQAYELLVGLWKPEQAVLCEGSIRWDEQHHLIPERPPLAQRVLSGDRPRSEPA